MTADLDELLFFRWVGREFTTAHLQVFQISPGRMTPTTGLIRRIYILAQRKEAVPISSHIMETSDTSDVDDAGHFTSDQVNVAKSPVRGSTNACEEPPKNPRSFDTLSTVL